MEPRNRYGGIDFASLCSLAGQYDKKGFVPARLAENRCMVSLKDLQIRALVTSFIHSHSLYSMWAIMQRLNCTQVDTWLNSIAPQTSSLLPSVCLKIARSATLPTGTLLYPSDLYQRTQDCCNKISSQKRSKSFDTVSSPHAVHSYFIVGLRCWENAPAIR